LKWPSWYVDIYKNEIIDHGQKKNNNKNEQCLPPPIHISLTAIIYYTFHIIVQQDDRFYDDDLDNDDDDDDDKLLNLDRQGRFQKAYQVALRTDTQGYCVAPGSTTVARSPQELTAMSWAAFCTSNLPEEEDAAMRIQALDCDNLFERLKLASHMLKEKKNRLQTAMEKAGIPFRQEEEEGEEEL
jgi:hypothetical protein